jgi:hypothetical protein
MPVVVMGDCYILLSEGDRVILAWLACRRPIVWAMFRFTRIPSRVCPF